MDYREKAIDELRAVKQLRAAERICRDRLAELTEELRSMKIPTPQTDPVQGGGSKTEERWLNIIADKEEEVTRLREVRRRLRRFEVAWAVLSDRDRTVLNEYYISGRWGAAERITHREHCDERTARRWRDEAIFIFARAFLGAVVP